ncbi:MAG: hypothetical protein JWP47_1303 [Polaromonas sp.]|jgi:hypothetical protein|nr:hypothetical protein [Polaromonas sp.]
MPYYAFQPDASRSALGTRAVTAHQAVQNSPALGQLALLMRESSERLKAIEALLPHALRSSIKAGPIDGESWCLLVSGNAAAAKLRQLTPLIQSCLADRGWKVTSIRVKILTGRQ